ncbi:DNA gyrase subunit A, partial [Amaricoccus sp. HAR-UPW-R2A-40]
MRNGKIAMKLPEGVRLIGARICSEEDDVMLTTRLGKAIRFPAPDVRVFKGRESTGVRGIRLAEGDEVVSMAIIRHFEASSEERDAYLKMRRAVAGAPEEEVEPEEGEEVADAAFELGQARYVAMSEAEDLLLTVTETGAGKLSSSHDYPVRGRGGQGVAAMDRAMRGGPLVTLMPVEQDAQIMLATDAGQSIRVPVGDISFRSRGAGGVKVFSTAEGERVVSVALVAETGEEEEGTPIAPSSPPGSMTRRSTSEGATSQGGRTAPQAP